MAITYSEWMRKKEQENAKATPQKTTSSSKRTTSTSSKTSGSVPSGITYSEWMEAKESGSEDIGAFVSEKRNSVSSRVNSRVTIPNDDIAPVAEKNDSKLDFFQKGLFEDGYDFGDITKTILGTAGDAGLGLAKGAGSLVEGLADLGTYGLAEIYERDGLDETAEYYRRKAQKNTIDEWTKGADEYLDQYSVFGRTSDAILQGIGQVGGIMATGGLAAAGGLGAAGVSALTTGVMGLSGMGSGMGEAYQDGATDEEAFKYGLISGAADALSELMFGGMGKAVNALGFSRGLSSADDILAKTVSGKFKNQIAKNFAEFGVKASAEGLEEVVAGVSQAMGKKMTYMSEKDFKDILADENLLEQFIVGSVTSGMIQSGIVPGTKKGSLIESNKNKTDFLTGATQNEQAVIKKEIENRIAEKEADGTKLTNRQKSEIEAQVERDLEKGHISIDTIEEVLGGDTYNTYKGIAEQEDAIFKEFEELGNKQNATLAEQARYSELMASVQDIKKTSQRDSLKSKLSEDVFNLAKSDRLVESYNERTRRGQAFEADMTKYDTKQQAVIQKAVDSCVLNNTNRTHEFVDMVAKISADKGVLFDFTNNENLKNSGFAVDGKTVNGYVTKDGVTLNIESAKSLDKVVGHEITHVLEGTEFFEEFQKTIVEYAVSKGEYDSRLNSLKEMYKDVKDADVYNELTADLVGDYLFTDENFINNLSTNNRNVFQKIYDEIKYLCKIATAGSKEARELERVKRAFEKAYKADSKAKSDAETVIDPADAKSLDYESPAKYSVSVTDQETIDFLENQDHITTYKAMVLIDGKLYPPMASKVKGEDGKYRMTNPRELGEWQQATEDTTNIKFNDKGIGYYDLKKDDGGTVRAAYNPYEHSSNMVLNDQFEAAYKRDNLVTVECEIPVSEMSSGYKAEYAKDSTGMMDWHSGVVAGKLKDSKRMVYLSRYLKAKRILSDAETAAMYKEIVGDTPVPFNVVSPGLLSELEKVGVNINYDGSPQYQYQQRKAAEREAKKAKYSISDTDGKQLTKEQQDYFKDSKVRDENGNLKVMYHGTPNGDFTVFKDGTYFTDSKEYADVYQSPSASSISTGKVASNPKTFEVYLDIKKPFDITDAEARNIYINDYIKGGNALGINPYMSDAEYEKIQTIDWTEGEDLRDFLIENEYDYDGLVLDEGGVGGYGEDVQSRGKSYVVFSPEQVKNIDNLKPTADKDIRYSLSSSEDVKKAESYFGTTYKISEAGYLLTDGKLLDFSGRHEGGSGGYRSVDHRDISDAFDGEYGDGSYSGGMVQFMQEGNIRLSPESGGINLSVKPNKEQLYTLDRYISNFRGEVILDIDDANGNTVVSIEYPKRTYSKRIINDITNYFDNGVMPEQPSSLGQFRYSLSHGDDADNKYRGRFQSSDLKLETAPTMEALLAETVAEDTTVAPAPKSTSDLAEIAANASRENFHGAYTQDGKQYLSDGSFIAEFNTVDESLGNNADFPSKLALRELHEASERLTPGNYDVYETESGYVKVGNSLFDSKYVNALIRAFDNPTFSVSNVRGGHEALFITGDNGRAVLMPVRAGENVNVSYEAKPMQSVSEMFPDDNAHIRSEMNDLLQRKSELEDIMQAMADSDDFTDFDKTIDEYAGVMESLDSLEKTLGEEETGRFASLNDADAPPEIDESEMVAPYRYKNAPVDDPFYDRDFFTIGKNRSVKAYMYENPEVKPFFQEEAQKLLGEYNDTIRGERIYNDELHYESGGEKGWTGISRHTSKSMETLLDDWGMSYADIEKGLKAIIEDNGAENIAAAKKIEFMLNDRLLHGYKNFYDRGYVKANQDYINMLRGKEVTEYSKEAFDSFMENAERYIPPEEDIAPVSQNMTKEAAVEAPADAPVQFSEQMSMFPENKPKNPNVAKILTEEPKTAKNTNKIWDIVKEKILDNGMVFEDLSYKTGNHEIQAKWNYIRNADQMAQRLIGNGTQNVKSLKDIKKEVDATGKTQNFYTYLYHMHNIDRMTLLERFGVENKSVFGETVDANFSRNAVQGMEKTNPEFKDFAKDVYKYNSVLRDLLVENDVISKETAKLWEKMYPHYVPIRRVGMDGLNINVPLDSNHTGVNAPVKRATGGSNDILPLFDTMADRTLQTYKAITKNSFGLELKDALRSTVAKETLTVDGVIDSLDAPDGLLQEGKNGGNPTFTVFENGERVTFEITDEMYEAMKPRSKAMSYRNKVLNTASSLHRAVLTQYNPMFSATNAIKDAQDILINSQHPLRTYLRMPQAYMEMASNGKWYTEYVEHGGEQNTYFDRESKTFKEDSAIKKVAGFPLKLISEVNDFIEMAPRLAEYIESRKEGRSIERSMLDAARVTTNFAAGGEVTKFINGNGCTFFSASVNGAVQQVRNFREAKSKGLAGWAGLAGRFALAGLPALVLNNLLWEDDEEYEELSDYVKQGYYVVGKTEEGRFIRIPKGRTVAVIQGAIDQVMAMSSGDDEADLGEFMKLVVDNIAPNNPIDNNIIAPIIQAAKNTTWYGEDLVPSRLQKVPEAEQYDEKTDDLSKWLGEKTNVSPYKINYLLNQYGGIISDVALPYITPRAESGDDSALGKFMAPMRDKFTTDPVINNQNVSDFYDKADELEILANSQYATEEDKMKSMYMDSVSWELSDLYKQKREIQNSDMSDSTKYNQARDVQEKINSIMRDALGGYNNVSIDGMYSEVGNKRFNFDEENQKWYEIREKNSDGSDNYWYQQEQKVTKGLGIGYGEYWNNRDEYNFAYDKPEQYQVARACGGYEAYKSYTSELWDIKADKDKNGKSINGSRKEKVIDWVNNLDADYGTKIILFKNEYNADDRYNYDIIDYLNGRDDISYQEMETILKYLDFEVDSEGNISW